MNRTKLIVSIASVIPAVILASGCSMSYSAPPVAAEIAAAESNTTAMGGSLYGGRQPITGAHIYMYAADTTAYGHASDSLLLSYTSGSYPSTKDANGNYYVTTSSAGAFYLSAGQYSCTAGQQVYMYSIGGSAGTGTNSAAGLIAVLGQCLTGGSFAGISEININEVSTVAAAYALSGYAVDATHIANAATNAAHVSAGTTTLANTAMANAFSSTALLYNVSTSGFGAALAKTPNGNGTVPQTLIHTIANILAGCINTTGPTSGACSSLFSDAESAGSTGTEPTDTASAAINIAHYPGNNVAKIFILSSNTVTPYLPNLGTTQPNDFTVAITYTVAGLNSPGVLAVDASGNIWTPNASGNSISKISPLGVPASGQPFTGGGLSSPYDLAIDASGNAWTPNYGSNVVSKFSSAGVPANSTGYAGNGHLNVPIGIAIDASGNLWIGNYSGNTVSEFNSSGGEVSGSPYSYTDADNPGGIAIDTTGDVWIANISNDYLAKLTSAGKAVTGSPYSSGGLDGSRFPAIDASNGAWITNYSGNSVTHLSSTGTGTNYTGAGLNEPNTLALDGAGHVWVANSGNSSISEFSSAGTAITGTSGYNNSLSSPFSVVVDGAGNVWVANDGNNTIVEYVGLAVPVVTPLVTAVTNKTLATQP